VLTAVAGARRGNTAFDRLWARTLPATVTVLPNQPGFDWSKVAALPGVTAVGRFSVYYGAGVEGMDGVDLGFPPANEDVGQTVERPVILAGRMDDPSQPNEAIASPHFMTAHHLQVGDTVTVRLSTPAQASLLALIGLALGIPLGLAVGRAVWRIVADFTPLAYHSPVAVLPLVLIAPVTLLAANLLAAWPGHRAARLRPGRILREE
jgi:hypothetical protein